MLITPSLSSCASSSWSLTSQVSAFHNPALQCHIVALHSGTLRPFGFCFVFNLTWDIIGIQCVRNKALILLFLGDNSKTLLFSLMFEIFKIFLLLTAFVTSLAMSLWDITVKFQSLVMAAFPALKLQKPQMPRRQRKFFALSVNREKCYSPAPI